MNPWRELGGLPAAAWALAAATFVNRAGSMVLSFLVLFLSKERGITREDAGVGSNQAARPILSEPDRIVSYGTAGTVRPY